MYLPAQVELKECDRSPSHGEFLLQVGHRMFPLNYTGFGALALFVGTEIYECATVPAAKLKLCSVLNAAH